MYLPHRSFRPLWDSVLLLLGFGLGFMAGLGALTTDLMPTPAEPAPFSVETETLVPEPEPVDPARMSVDELMEESRWGHAQRRCSGTITKECRNVHLKLMRRGLSSEDFDNARSIASWLKGIGDSFGQRPGTIIVAPSEAREVLRYCAVSRLVDPDACRGLDSLIANGIYSNGETLTIHDAKQLMRAEGLYTDEADQPPNYAIKAEDYARRQLYRKAIKTCEKGLGHQRFACGWRIDAWERRLGIHPDNDDD